MLQVVAKTNSIQKTIVLVAVIALSLFVAACGETEQTAPPIESTAVTAPETVAAVTKSETTAVATAVQAIENETGLEHGFEFMDMDGNLRNSNEWKGKPLMINYWATWCVPCRKEMPVLMELHAKYADQGFEVIGIAADEPDNILRFLEKTPVAYTILHGESDSVFANSKGYGNTIGVLPHSAFVDRNGVVRHSKVGEVTHEEVEAFVLDIL